VDTGERGRNLREKMNVHNNEAGRAVSPLLRQRRKFPISSHHPLIDIN
jgi:hypothetical protein